MEAEYKLFSKLQDDVLIINTIGYVNNEGGEQIAR